MTKVVNGFEGGMNKDLSKNKYSNSAYYDAKNLRLFTQDGVSSGALEDIYGTVERIDLSNQEGIIIGYCVLRDKLILFYTSNLTDTPTDTSNDYILSIPIADIDALTGTDKIEVNFTDYHKVEGDGFHLIYTGALMFCAGNPIQAIPRYETDSVQKIYFSDGYNPLRWMNVIYNEETNDLENLPPDYFEQVGEFNITKPVVTNVIPGNLTSGKIQYAYQMYVLNGSATTFSVPSDLVHITNESDTDANDYYYEGADIDVQCGKGFRVEVPVDNTYYTRIRLVAIHYSSLDGEPEIRIVDEKGISTDTTTVIFNDSGNSIGTLTLEEFRTTGTIVFNPSVIETKDNILFAGGISEDVFDVEFDARAYRFAGNSGDTANYNYGPAAIRNYAFLYQENDVDYYRIDKVSKELRLQPAGTLIGDWEDMPLEADCINRYNDQQWDDTDRQYAFRYQSDGVTLGGEGPNVSYRFITEELEIDSYNIIGEPTIIQQDLEGVADNFSYTGYASPIRGGGDKIGYLRDEVYRFGVVFYDSRGRTSFVKWIGDIRMPSVSAIDGDASTYNICYWDNPNTRTISKILGIEFTINNIDSLEGVVGYQIVRVKREELDRSILAQGIMNQPVENGPHFEPTHWSQDVSGETPNDWYHFHSPDLSFNTDIEVQEGIHRLRRIATAIHGDNSVGYQIVARTGELDNYNWFTRYSEHDPMTTFNEYQTDRFTTFKGEICHDNKTLYLSELGEDYESFYIVVQPGGNSFRKASTLSLRADNTGFRPTSHIIDRTNPYISNYIVNVHFSRYGGINYSARRRNLYQGAGDYEDVATSTTTVFGGDTYIGLFDTLYGTVTGSGTSQSEFLVFPVETRANLSLRAATCLTKLDRDEDYAYKLHEYPGEYTHPDGIFIQEEPYYIYNTVYSKENDADLFISEPFDFISQQNFDTRVYASNVKINGETLDSWLIFPANQFIDVDSQYGRISSLNTVNNKLLFFQTRAFGVLSVNDRALLETANIATLTLGVSGLLDRYDYAKTGIGTWHWRHTCLTSQAFYWVDALAKEMYVYGQGIEEISLIQGMDSWSKDNLDNFSINVTDAMHVYRDPEFKEVNIVSNKADQQFALVYNELTRNFTSFTDLYTRMGIVYTDNVLGFVYDEEVDKGYEHVHRHNDDKNNRGRFYTDWYNAHLTLLINASPNDTTIFNNFEWFSECFNFTNPDIILDHLYTFKWLTMWNDYQNTGRQELVLSQNIRRRMRKWRYTIPRAVYRGQSSSLQPVTERYARMRDTHLFAKFEYEPEQVAGRKFIFHDIITSVTISNK